MSDKRDCEHMHYAVLIQGTGEGCGYTIGCNERLEIFPTYINSLEEAESHFLEETDSPDASQLSYYNLDKVGSITIMKVDMLKSFGAFFAANKQKQLKEAAQRAKDEADYQRLKEKLGK